VAKKVLTWQTTKSKPKPTEIQAEIRRLQNLLSSHKVLLSVSVKLRSYLDPN
jgi:hypothetical protein